MPVLNVFKWSDAMFKIADNPHINDKISNALNSYAQKTSWENTAQEHCLLFKNI